LLLLVEVVVVFIKVVVQVDLEPAQRSALLPEQAIPLQLEQVVRVRWV
jgi:hypothetical protein